MSQSGTPLSRRLSPESGRDYVGMDRSKEGARVCASAMAQRQQPLAVDRTQAGGIRFVEDRIVNEDLLGVELSDLRL